MTRKRLFGLSLLMLALLPFLMQCGQKSAAKKMTAPDLISSLKEGKPAYSKAEIQAYIDELTPVVEKATGRKLIIVPQCKLVDRKELVSVLKEELIPQLKQLMPQATKTEIEYQAETTAEIYSMVMIGKYGFKTHTLYMLPGNMEPLMNLAKVDKKLRMPVLKLMVAHEMVHCLQDQEVGLDTFIQNSKTEDEAMAKNAAMEGHATFVMEEVAHELKLTDAAKEFERLNSPGLLKDIDPATELGFNIEASRLSQIYMTGRDFMAWHAKQGGTDKLWQIMNNPPTSTSMIIHPETYSVDAAVKTDYESALNGCDKLFGIKNSDVKNTSIGEIALRSVYYNMEPKTRDEILSDLEHVQAYVATNGNSVANVSLYIMKNTSTSPRFISALEDMARLNIKKLQKSTVVKIDEFIIADFKEVKAKAASKVSFIQKSDGSVYNYSIIRIARGRIMMEICTINLIITDKKAAIIAESIFNKLPAAITSEL